MRIRWSANLSMLWRERPFVERFALAKQAGFSTVEFWWPRGEDPGEVEAAVKENGLSVAVLNMDAGDLDAGDRGFLNLPERRPEVIEAARRAIALAQAVGSPLMNCPVGKDSGASQQHQADAIVEALRQLADDAMKAGVLVTLEPLNSIDHPSYLMCSSALAREWIDRVGYGVGLLYDAYHMGCMGEDIISAPGTLKPAHIQIADCPGRHEPGTGQLPYDAFFNAIEASDYAGYVGLEYAPLHSTEDSLGWLSDYRSRIAADVVR